MPHLYGPWWGVEATLQGGQSVDRGRGGGWAVSPPVLFNCTEIFLYLQCLLSMRVEKRLCLLKKKPAKENSSLTVWFLLGSVGWCLGVVRHV